MKSFGTGSVVKLPGSGPQQSNIYSFDTTYEEMFQDLIQKDPQLYPIIYETKLPFLVRLSAHEIKVVLSSGNLL